MDFRRAFFAAIAALGILTPLAARAADSSPFANLKWRSIGPAVGGGRVAAVAGTATDPSLYYIGSAGGGVWKSDNGAATWTAVFENEPVAAIGAVTIDPRDKNVVWVGTGEANPRNDVSYGDGVYKTTDGGATWTNVGLHDMRYTSRILVDPTDSNHVIVGGLGDIFKDSTAGGVYVTFDGGKTWTHSLYVGPATGASELTMDPDDPDTMYAGLWQFRREPWTFHSGGPDDGIYKSTDGGKTWTRLTGNGLPSGYTGRIAIAIAPSDPKRIYAVIEAKGGILWRSDDGGATWSMVSDDTLVDQRPFYFTHITVDPKNEDHVYAVSELLAESKDGGKHFHETAAGVHVDYHAMWIAPNDPKRMMTGEDGGYALSLDGGRNWSFSRNIPIGEVYHVDVSVGENPYWVCAPLQDNNGFCGPSNSRDREGIKDSDWLRVVGGDGEWAVFDPGDPNHILTDSETAYLSDYNRSLMLARNVSPYSDFDRNNFALYNRKYRFNWDSPVGFAPWNHRLSWVGGNVLFQSPDRGLHWTPISPDLTLDDKAHQQPAGGPLALDVSSAEFSDTLLDIEGSPVRAGEIWVGTDDGLVQVTLDDGKHWNRVEPKDVGPYGRVETVAPSPLDPATAYANVDRHRSGDYAPYLFVTHNYGKTWKKIVTGLPADQYVRTVRPDIHNKNLIFAGTEQGLWISYDGGASWSSFRMNLPTVSVRDIRIQPEFDDLVIATHGRDLWILDDLRSIEDLPSARARGAMLFPVRTAYQYLSHDNDEGLYTRFSGTNPPSGAILDFYQASPQANAPGIEILDARGRVVRHIKPEPKHRAAAAGADAAESFRGFASPGVSNLAGINRVVWDFRTDGVTQWMGAARPQYRGSPSGPAVVPGIYIARIVLGGRTYSQSFAVKADPRSPYTQADDVATYAFARKYLRVSGQINTVLNHLDAQKASLAAAATANAGNAAMLARVNAAMRARDAIFSTFTADYHNDEDSIQRPGALREDTPGGYGGSPPTAQTLEFAARYDKEYRAGMAAYDAYLRTTLAPLSKALQASGGKPIAGAIPVSP